MRPHRRTYGQRPVLELIDPQAAIDCVCNTLAKKAITTAKIKGYHDRPTPILPCKDVALVIWGCKIMGDTSSPPLFHGSKEMAQNYLRTHPNNKWPGEHFDEVGWKHLKLALKNTANIYKIWCSKQTSVFCGTQVKVGLHSGEAFPDE